MALLQINIHSDALKRDVSMMAVLPVDKTDLKGRFTNKGPFKTLYMLHGLLGNYMDWTQQTIIERLATEKDLAVIMPSGDNSFYVDREGFGNEYGRFIGEEIVELSRRMFPLSEKREDTFIGGLSMGGFGAMRNGLLHPETFGYIGSFSGALHIFEQPTTDPDYCPFGEDKCFGDIKEVRFTDKNPRVGFLTGKEQKKTMPSIYMVCGTEDPLLEANRSFRDFLQGSGADLTYKEAPGTHNWDFWGTWLPDFLDWLPLGEATKGSNSGNVREE